MADVSFSERELEIMTVLWNRGSGTVAEVRDALRHDPAHTTVLTLLRILEGKGHVRREPEGKGHRYHPLVAQSTAARSALRRVLGTVFGGEPELLVTELLADDAVDPDTLRRLRRLVDERLGEESDGGVAGAQDPGGTGRKS
jgi:BlaI family transcriptional regulator, penicillinase repressor